MNANYADPTDPAPWDGMLDGGIIDLGVGFPFTSIEDKKELQQGLRHAGATTEVMHVVEILDAAYQREA